MKLIALTYGELSDAPACSLFDDARFFSKRRYFSIVDILRRSALMSVPILMRGGFFPARSSYVRLLVGDVVSFIMFQVNQQLSPFASTSLTILTNVGNLQIFLTYFGATVLVARPSEVLRSAVGWALLFAGLFVSVVSTALQIALGNAQAEVEQSMLEYEAREADLMMSTRELRADVDKLREPYGDVSSMTHEQKGAMDIHKGVFKYAETRVHWTIPEEGDASPMSTKALARQFTRGEFPCFGACASV